MRFEIGDRVRLRRGWTEMEVLDIRRRANGRYQIKADYVSDGDRNKAYSNGAYARWRPAEDYVPWDGDTSNKPGVLDAYETEQENIPMSKLYQTKEATPRFGTQLAVNSAGQIVLEMKGTGAVEAFDKAAIEEVLPFTIKAVAISRDNYVCHYVVAKDAAAEGDLLLSNSGNLYLVKEVDTKNKSPKGEFKGSVFTPAKKID